jgi:hypothetical protein
MGAFEDAALEIGGSFQHGEWLPEKDGPPLPPTCRHAQCHQPSVPRPRSRRRPSGHHPSIPGPEEYRSVANELKTALVAAAKNSVIAVGGPNEILTETTNATPIPSTRANRRRVAGPMPTITGSRLSAASATRKHTGPVEGQQCLGKRQGRGGRRWREVPFQLATLSKRRAETRRPQTDGGREQRFARNLDHTAREGVISC